jgi:hypothetical protein
MMTSYKAMILAIIISIKVYFRTVIFRFQPCISPVRQILTFRL